MSYVVTYRHAYNTTSERWDGPLGEAQAKAVHSVATCAADCVEIRDSKGKLVDRYPAAAWQ